MIAEAKVSLYYLHKTRRLHADSKDQRDELFTRIETFMMEIDHLQLLIQHLISRGK